MVRPPYGPELLEMIRCTPWSPLILENNLCQGEVAAMCNRKRNIFHPDLLLVGALPDRREQVGGELLAPRVHPLGPVQLNRRTRPPAVQVDRFILAVKFIVTHAGHAISRGFREAFGFVPPGLHSGHGLIDQGRILAMAGKDSDQATRKLPRQLY